MDFFPLAIFCYLGTFFVPFGTFLPMFPRQDEEQQEQDQMNLDLGPREKTIQVQSNRYFAINDHKKAMQDQN